MTTPLLFVEACGLFTPVGRSVATTAAALYTKVARFTELSSRMWNGEPFAGAQTALESIGERRLVELAAFALEQCADVSTPVPAFICLPRTVDAPFFLRELSVVSGVAIDLHRSRLWRGGAGQVAAALVEARKLLLAGLAATCVVGAADSLVDPPALAALAIDGRRLKQDGISEGFVPGEGGAFLRLSLRPESWSLAAIAGVGLAEEPQTLEDDAPSSAAGMRRAIHQSATEAGLRTEDVGCLAHNGSGERYSCLELALSLSQVRLHPEIRQIAPALSTGETGTAAGAISLAYLAFLISKGALGVSSDVALAVCSSAGPERSAVLLHAIRGRSS